jgi:3-oxoacyl-[acyl-carrier protein] reductase
MSIPTPVALITGASRGIGRATATCLASEGYDLFLVARKVGHLDDIVAEAETIGRRAVGFGADFARAEAPEQVHGAFVAAFDRLDVLVNNAGVAISGPFGGYDATDWDRVMNVNARTPFFLTQALLPLLGIASPGFVINIASVVAKRAYESQSLYSASKHALLGFTKSLARETVNEGIRVHAILPGGVDTEMLTGVRADINASELISANEVANVIVGLLKMRGNAVIDEIEIRRRTKTPWA